MDYSRALEDQGFRPDRALPAGLDPAVWGTDGKRWVFVYEDPSADRLGDQLQRVRDFVNGQYRLPRPMRFRSPFMLLAAILSDPDETVDAFVHASATSGWMGGEVFYLAALTLPTDRLTFPEPKGHRNQRAVEAVRFRMFRPDEILARLVR